MPFLAALEGGCDKPASSQSSSSAEREPETRVTKANIEKAKQAIKPPMPAADARAKIVELLGEPTATEGESLIWAGVTGSECHELKLFVSKGTANGTTSGMASTLITNQFEKCAKLAGE